MKLANNILVQTEAGSFAPKKHFWFYSLYTMGSLLLGYQKWGKGGCNIQLIRRSNTSGYKNM